jgi:phosphoribosyl 1,2-cyclic phosphodiesterase
MELIVIASGSARNGYVLKGETSSLIIECGCRLSEVKKAVEYNMQSVAGCLVSHSHGDHAGYIASYLKAGIIVMSSRETLEAKQVNKNHFAKVIHAGKGYSVGEFKVIPFDLEHDVRCYGFIIEHPEMGRLIFMTDTWKCDYKMPPAHHVLIEANYSEKILDENIASGRTRPIMRQRLIRSHMEINEAKAILSRWDLSHTRTILLIHMSDKNREQALFEKEIEQVTGKTVVTAEKGLRLNINLEPY